VPPRRSPAKVKPAFYLTKSGLMPAFPPRKISDLGFRSKSDSNYHLYSLEKQFRTDTKR
jgi:hypothetical protein